MFKIFIIMLFWISPRKLLLWLSKLFFVLCDLYNLGSVDIRQESKILTGKMFSHCYSSDCSIRVGDCSNIRVGDCSNRVYLHGFANYANYYTLASCQKFPILLSIAQTYLGIIAWPLVVSQRWQLKHRQSSYHN